MLLIFKAANRTNYSKEAITVLVQYHSLLSPRQREQLVWSRFVNTKGKPGANKPCDLHIEHLNRTVKTALSAQSSNLKPSAIIELEDVQVHSMLCVNNLTACLQHRNLLGNITVVLGKKT